MTTADLDLDSASASKVASPLSAALVRKRTRRGALLLGVRQAAVIGVSVIGGIALAHLLTPGAFGYYAIAALVMSFAGLLGDGGLGAALIRRHEAPSARDLQSVFTLQIAITCTVALMCGVGVLAAGAIGAISNAALLVIASAALAPVIAVFKTVPTVCLERDLRFGAMTACGVVETVMFNGVAVGLAAAGLGLVSIAVALLAGPVAGALFMATSCPWHFSVGIDVANIRPLLKFGLPYQGSGLVSLARDSISPVFVGLFVGATQVGYVEWAGRLASYAVIAVFVVQRLLLSSLARLRHESQVEFERLVKSALRFSYMAVAPLAVTTLVFAAPITELVFGPQWRPGLPVFWYLWVPNLIVPAATVAVAALNALGESRLTFRYSFASMVGTWMIGVPCILCWGFVGFGVASLLVQCTNLWLVRSAARRFRFPWVRTALPEWALAAAAAGAGWLLARAATSARLEGLIVGCAASLVIYGGSVVIRNGSFRSVRIVRE